MIGKDGREREGICDIEASTPGYGVNAVGYRLKGGFPKTIYVHFESEADIEDFSKLIGGRITRLTKAVWYRGTKLKGELNES